jgi:hypothetical protein
MKVALLCAKFNYDGSAFINKTCKFLNEKGISVDIDYNKTSSEDDKKNLKELYYRLEKMLKNSDAIILDNTPNQAGLAFILGRIRELGKPVLLLYNENANDHSNIVKAYSNYYKLIYSGYTLETLEGIIFDFIKKVKELSTSKLLIRLSPETQKFLENESTHTGKSKAQIIRELIEDKLK